MSAGIPSESLLGELSKTADPRSRRGRRYPLGGLLGMLILGALHGEGSLRGMWMWGTKHWAEIAQPLGFTGNRRPPVYGTVWYVVSALDSEALDRAFQEWTLSWAQGHLSLARRVALADLMGQPLGRARKPTPGSAVLP